MIALCPPAPPAKSDLDVTLAELKVNSEFIRFHSPAYGGNAFNPNTGRKMEDPTAGARFSPFPDLHGVNVPTTHAGSTTQASALESVFHDVPHVPNPPTRPTNCGSSFLAVCVCADPSRYSSWSTLSFDK
jgi:hypothetical protein